MKKLSLLLTLFICWLTISYAQPAHLDLSFGKGGIVQTALGADISFSSSGKQVLLGSDGSMYAIFESPGFAFIVKKHPDGSTDSTYGINGISMCVVIQNVHASMQSDGKIVVAGTVSVSGDLFVDFQVDHNFALSRYNTDGTLDQNFGLGGKVITDFGDGQFEALNSLAIQSDGKIVVAGFTIEGDSNYIIVARYKNNGSLDSTFATNGRLNTLLTTNRDTAFNEVAIQTNGKIIVAGSNSHGLNLIRLNTNGSADNSFHATKRLTNPDGSYFAVRALAIQNDQKIIVGGVWNNSNKNKDFVLARFTTTGSLDNTFDADGIVTTDFKIFNDVINSIAIQGDGRIVATGSASNGTTDGFAIARYNTNGSLDSSFNGNGKRMTYVSANNIYANSIAIQSNGKLLLAGYEQAGAATNIVLVRYNTGGSFDSTFNHKGTLLYHFQQKKTIYNSTAIQKDGKIVTAGYCWNGSNYNFAIARYNTNGSFDNSFDGDGRLTMAIGADDYATSLVIQNDGKIIVAGYSLINNNYDFAIVRLNANGSLDNSFSGDGKQTTDFSAHDDYARSVVLAADGKIIVAGQSNNDIALARYTTNGSLDNSFDGDGKLTKDFSSSNDNGNSVAIQSDGKIVVVATSKLSYPGGKIYVLRYNINGTPDNTFNNIGFQTITIFDFFEADDGGDVTANSVAIQNDGKIIVGGHASPVLIHNFSDNSILVRYKQNGSLDSSFSDDGKLIVPFDNFATSGVIGLENDGKILVQANISRVFYNIFDDETEPFPLGFAFARINNNGTPDSTFGNNGTQNSALDNITIQNIAIDSNKLYAVGFDRSASNFGFLTRYLLGGTGLSQTLEAEDAVLNGAVVASSVPGFTGTGYADYVHASGDYVEWTVNITTAGSYSLKFRYANGGLSNRPLQLKVNGTVVNATLAFSPTGAWTAWSVSSATANLIAGTNKITLTSIGSNGPNVDNVTITTNTVTLEAEDAVLNGAAVGSGVPGFSGTGYADYVHASGDYIEWTANAPTAGLYSLQFRYGNGGTSNRPLQLKVNGAVANGSLAFLPTGAWTTWSVSSATANLIAGTNKIRLTTTGFNGPNVDYLAFNSNNPIQPLQRLATKEIISKSANLLKAFVSPNPVSGTSKLIITSSSDLPVNVQLVDMLGRSYKSAGFLFRGSNIFDFSANDLPSGSYIIIVKQGNLSTHARLIVTKK